AGTSGINVYASTNGGSNWTANGAPANTSWFGAASSADGTRLAVVSQKTGIYSSTNSGGSWVSNSVPAFIWQSVASSADGNKLAAVIHYGGIWVSQTT